MRTPIQTANFEPRVSRNKCTIKSRTEKPSGGNGPRAIPFLIHFSPTGEVKQMPDLQGKRKQTD